jgi:hypothetical protein
LCNLDSESAFGLQTRTPLKRPCTYGLGFSAGEPVEEDKDLFGATVQNIGLDFTLDTNASDEQLATFPS